MVLPVEFVNALKAKSEVEGAGGAGGMSGRRLQGRERPAAGVACLSQTKALLKKVAREQGFQACGIAAAQRPPHSRAFQRWIDDGHAADMDWLKRGAGRRTDPALVLPAVKSIVVVAANYWQGTHNSARPTNGGRIARYAWGRDYHHWMIERMLPLQRTLEMAGGTQRAYVDTGPVLERDFAALCGVGWHGKSTMLIDRELGTWFFLGVILTTLRLDPDEPQQDRCGSCTRCMDACPTRAIIAPYVLDSRRCLAWITIENKGAIPDEFREALGDRIFGCDDCLDACPWNRFAAATRETVFQADPGIHGRSLRDWLDITENEFQRLFRHSPIRRLKRSRFLRNVCVALGNIGSKDDLDAIGKAAADPDPMIAEHARWAVRQIRMREERS